MINTITKIFKSFKNRPMLLFVNLPGLAIGLAAFLLLMVYIKYETNYDKHFANKDRVVRLYNTIIENNSSETYPICLREAYTEIPLQVPEIYNACQIYRGWGSIISFEEKHFENQNMLYVDDSFFNVFGLDLIIGDNNSALSELNTVVLSMSLAEKIFNNIDCVGKVIRIDEENYSIRGVIEDLPATTHFQFDLLVSMSTIRPERFGGLELFTYYLLRQDVDLISVQEKVSTLNDKYLGELFESHETETISGIELLSDIHLHTKADFDLSEKGNLKHIYIISLLAVFILLIAIINYVNLFVLSGEKRFLEIGIRKTMGASLFSLRKIFFTETALITIIAFIIAFFITQVAIPMFSSIMDLRLSLYELLNPISIVGVVVFLVLLILIAGAYPAIYLSKLDVIDAIRGGTKSMKRKKWLSISSVVTQFSISIFLVVCLLIVNFQINYLKDVPLGFNPEKVIGISGFDNNIRSKTKSITDEISKLPFIVNVSTSSHFMGGGVSGQGLRIYGESETTTKSINEYRVQAGFCETMQLKLLYGRSFNGTLEDKSSIILNETAVKMMGLENPIGTTVVMHSDPIKIIGVVNDFYYNENAGEPIAPLALTAGSDYSNVFYLKTSTDLSKDQEQQIEEIFKQFSADYNFHSFKIKDQYNNKFYNEDRLLMLLMAGTFLAIFLSFIGMYALSAYSVERRVKEIGIRKVLGSSSKQVMIKLLTDILRWVFWSMPFAFLMSFLLMRRWLDNFANRIDLNVFYFLVGGAIALLIAIIAISIKSFAAANRNPVDSLRSE